MTELIGSASTEQLLTLDLSDPGEASRSGAFISGVPVSQGEAVHGEAEVSTSRHLTATNSKGLLSQPTLSNRSQNGFIAVT